jgi:hypothetical protein
LSDFMICFCVMKNKWSTVFWWTMFSQQRSEVTASTADVSGTAVLASARV